MRMLTARVFVLSDGLFECGVPARGLRGHVLNTVVDCWTQFTVPVATQRGCDDFDSKTIPTPIVHSSFFLFLESALFSKVLRLREVKQTFVSIQSPRSVLL